MQTFKTKTSAKAYAKSCGWTEVDSARAIKSGGIKTPIDEITLLNAMVRFAGPELINRQNLQKAQKNQVNQKTTYIQKIELKHAASIQKFQDEVREERSHWLGLIRIMYSIVSKFGMKDPMIEHILSTYDAA
jgi:hypothetical protein